MRFDVTIFPLNEFVIDDLVKEDLPEKYILDKNGDLAIADATLNSQNEFDQLIDFVFNGRQVVREIYRTTNEYILDLLMSKQFIVDFDYLESNYAIWLEKSQRENTMNEYGMLIDFIGFIRKGIERQFLLMLVSIGRRSS